MPASSCDYQVRLLGGFELLRGSDLVALPGPAARVVAFLALRRHARRGMIADALWPDAPGIRSQAYLRSALWRLNTATPGLVLSSPGSMLSIGPGAHTDAVDLLAWALTVGHDGDDASRLPEREWLGRDLLPGWDDTWLDDHREQLQVLVPEALEAAATARLEARVLTEALWYALRAHQLDPLRESAVRLLVSIYKDQSNYRLARDTLRRYRHTLRDELGVEPSSTLTNLLPAGMRDVSRHASTR